MIRTFLEEIVLPILLFLLIRPMLRTWFAPRRSTTPAPRATPSAPSSAELKKDPVCGTYVTAASGFTRTVKGEVVCFCSKECLDRFRG
jgi:YHS domain-containing protein